MMISRRAAVLGALTLSATALHFHAQSATAAEDGWYSLKGDDGKPVSNTRIPVELSSEIEHLPGVIWIGSKGAAATIYEFYDYNCPYCPLVVEPLHKLMQTEPELRVGLINNAILSPKSVQAARMEQAVLKEHGPAAAYEFYRRLFAFTGPKDGQRALAVARSMDLVSGAVMATAAGQDVAETISAQMKLAADLGLSSTPSFVAGDASVTGFPGPIALSKMVKAVGRCGTITCRS